MPAFTISFYYTNVNSETVTVEAEDEEAAVEKVTNEHGDLDDFTIEEVTSD